MEIAGAELPLNYPLLFTNNKFAIFCWTNSKIYIQANSNTTIYKSRNNPMNQYLMAHNLINERRKEALVGNRIGPNVLITGTSHSGKTTLCHILLNYAVKLGWTPLYVDLDLSNEITVPGNLSAAVIDYPIPNDFLIDSAISLFHGNPNNEINFYLYEKQISEMANIIKSKMENELEIFKKKLNIHSDKNIFVNSENPTVYASGSIVNCPTISKDNIYKLIVNEFDCDFIFVIENEKLYHDLVKTYKNSKVQISMIPKSRGVVSLDNNYKEYVEQKRYSNYFKGPFNNLRLNELSLDLNSFKLLQIISSNVTSSILPIGTTSDLNLIIKEINLEEENLLNRVVAILHLDDKVINDLDSNYDRKLNSYVEHFSRAPVAFMAYIIKFDKINKSIKIHTSCSELRHKYLIVGNVKYTNI